MDLLNNNKGFTLIELLVVIAIIGILASLMILSIGSSRNRARDARRMSDLRQIQSAQELVMGDDESYKKSAAGDVPAIENAAGRRYMVSVKDPVNNSSYKYIWVANDVASCAGLPLGKYYCVVAKLEEKKGCGFSRYFVVNNKGAKEVCRNDDYVANPSSLLCSDCLAF